MNISNDTRWGEIKDFLKSKGIDEAIIISRDGTHVIDPSSVEVEPRSIQSIMRVLREGSSG